MKDSVTKIYLLVGMDASPFKDSSSLELFKRENYVITDKIRDADIIVAHNVKHLLPYALIFPGKKFLVWTNEPRYDTIYKNELKLPLFFPNIQIMNVYGKDVFWHNLHFLSSYHYYNKMNLGIEIGHTLPNISKEKFSSLNKNNKVSSIYTNTLGGSTKLMKDGKNIDLNEKRCKYALTGYKRNLLHIYGNKWPKGYAVDNSGYGFEKNVPWWTEKINLLKDYKYNLCFENTACPYYITEKIWHAIFTYNLPIYTSFNSTIYETFPKDSFIDATLFKDENDLFDYLGSMSLSDHIDRLNLCIDAFNKSMEIKKENYNKDTDDMVKKIILRLNSMK